MKYSFLIIFLSLRCIVLSSQPEIWREYYEKSGLFCGRSITLFKDSTFLYETGCEGRSHVCFGKYTKNRKIIILNTLDTTGFNPILSFNSIKVDSIGTKCIIKVIDKYNQPIKKFSLLFDPEGDEFNVDVSKERGRLIYNIQKRGGDLKFKGPSDTNVKGVCTLENKNGVIKLMDLKQLFLKDYIIDVNKSDHNYYTIQLNIHRSIFSYPELTWLNLNTFTYKNKKKKIIQLE